MLEKKLDDTNLALEDEGLKHRTLYFARQNTLMPHVVQEQGNIFIFRK